MGVDFYLKRLVLGNERNVNVQVWDVAGSALTGKMTDKVLSAGHEGLPRQPSGVSGTQCEDISKRVRHTHVTCNHT